MPCPRPRVPSFARRVPAPVAGLLLAAGGLLAVAGCAGPPPTEAERRATMIAELPGRTPHLDRPGLLTFERDGRLWVFRPDGAGLARFLETGDPVRHVAFVRAGPEGRTIRSDDRDALLEYVAHREGFRVFADEGRLRVFRAGAPELAGPAAAGGLEGGVIVVGAGPRGATVEAPDRGTLLEYLASRPGFVVSAERAGAVWRLWIFDEESPALETFRRTGRLDESVTWIGQGPLGTTVRSDDRRTLIRHAATAPGFRVFLCAEERLWVFRAGSDEAASYRREGPPARSYTRIAAGPRDLTVRSTDRRVVADYLAVVRAD